MKRIGKDFDGRTLYENEHGVLLRFSKWGASMYYRIENREGEIWAHDHAPSNKGIREVGRIVDSYPELGRITLENAWEYRAYVERMIKELKNVNS